MGKIRLSILEGGAEDRSCACGGMLSDLKRYESRERLAGNVRCVDRTRESVEEKTADEEQTLLSSGVGLASEHSKL